ncbi:MAG TPA: helix-turn-helix domain-containing protein, partial [Puia sp.]|nr:helix-turn-helix domain-containing protein [Puia sp.]
EKAAIFLQKSDLTIAEVAYMAGFSTPNYFARAFKAKYAMLPSEYADRMRNGDGGEETQP